MYTTRDQARTKSKCGSCLLSRRCFLAGTAAAMAAPWFRAHAAAAERGDLTEYIDLASFRPKPTVRVISGVVRLKPPYWLGWPGTSYDVEGHRKEYAQNIAEIGKRLGVDIAEEPAPLEDEAAVTAFAAKLQTEKPDAALVTLQHLSAWNLVDIAAKSGVPTIVFSPIGTSFTQHVVEISRRPGVCVVSSLETAGIEQALRMVRAKRQLEVSRLLVVAGDQRSETATERLGTTVCRVPRPMLNELFAKMPVTDEVRQVAADVMAGAKNRVEPNDDDVINAARSYITAKRLMRDENANAITTDCLGMVTQKLVPTPPCMAATLFQDAGVTYGCEADLNAAFSLMLVSYLFDKPAFMNDPVPETVKNQLVVAHCSSASRLNGFDAPAEPYILRSHSESDMGVSMQVLWKEGQPVTLVCFQNPNQLILDTGTVSGNVDTPPAGGCRTSVELAMDRIEDVRDVMGFHQAVFYGNHRRDVEAFCQMYGIKVVNSPERAPRATST